MPAFWYEMVSVYAVKGLPPVSAETSLIAHHHHRHGLRWSKTRRIDRCKAIRKVPVSY